MKKLWHSIAICSTLLIYISSCTPSAKDDGLGHNHDHGSHGGGDHGGEIVLSTEQAQKFGVYSQMVKPLPSRLPPANSATKPVMPPTSGPKNMPERKRINLSRVNFICSMGRKAKS